ncbi:MAG: C39 family peptidase [Defluviitaleaceae bacterium]|nr:C39 family peptidase [Defluviitaleaceae bacterium]
MKKVIIALVVLVILAGSGLGVAVLFVIRGDYGNGEPVLAANQVPVYRLGAAEQISMELLANPPESPQRGMYQVFVAGLLLGEFETIVQAHDAASSFDNVFIRQVGSHSAVWDNYPPFFVFFDETTYDEFLDFGEAVAYARRSPVSYIYHRRDQSRIWSHEEARGLPESHMIYGVPQIYQLPALPRGCEVTSLAMILNFRGIYVDKMQLADEVRRDPTQGGIVNGRVYMGDPNYGFIGNMHDITEFGYGVYHRPIFDLLRSYYPNQAVDLTGAEFDDLLQFVARDIPVWIVTNTRFHYLPSYQFFTAHTPGGERSATWRMHAVVITGYDQSHIFFNDPLGNATFAPRSSFEAAWVQMGSQAVALSR